MPLPEPTEPLSRTDALLRITQAIETAATLDELLLLALNELTQLFDAQRGAVILLDDGGTTGQVICEFPPQVSLPPPRPLGESPALARAARERQPVQLTLIGAEDDPFLQGCTRGAMLIVPLVAQDRAIGLLLLCAGDGGRNFGGEEIALARVLAGQIAAAVTAARQSERAQRRNAELATLNEIATTVTSTLDAHEVYRLVVQKLNEYFQVDAGSIFLIDEQTGDLRIEVTIEGGKEQLPGTIIPRGRGIVGHVAETGQPAIVHDAQNDPRFYAKVSEDVGYVTRTILCVPMQVKGRVIGALELLNKRNGHFTEDDAERLMRMAAFIAVALENARLFQEVADGRDRLAAILNSTADGILMTDMHGRVLSANPTAAALFAAPERALLGRSLDELLQALHASARAVVTRTWGGDEADAREGPPITEIELGGTQRRFIRHLTMPVRDAAGEIYGQLAIFRDITQEKELEQLREDWTGMLVHDLRAPLTSIMNGIAMLQRGLGGPVTDQQRELLNIAYQGSNALLELVNNLLDISRMEQGSIPLDIEPLVPYVLIDAAVERLRASANSHRVSIDQRLAVNLPTIEADEAKIVRVLQNLLDNAIKFAPSGSAVTLGAHYVGPGAALPPEVPVHPPMTDGAWLIMWVQDRGPGIPAAYHGRIFEKFGQVRGRKVRGTGLGLTFCKLAVEAHGGQIWLESQEGSGSVFAFALPLNRGRGADGA
jgi:PAS domain S-box-containing protein